MISWDLRRAGWRTVMTLAVIAAIAAGVSPAPTQAAGGGRAYSKMSWTPQGTDKNNGGEYQSDIPNATVACTAGTQGMLVKTMWLPHTYSSGGRWVEHGWFKGLAFDGTCKNTGSFYYGYTNSSGQYQEVRYTNLGNLQVGAWNTFRLVYSGYYSGNHYYRMRMNGTLVADVVGGAPLAVPLQVGFETDQASNCTNALTKVKEWKKYKTSDDTWGYPEYASATRQISDFTWSMSLPYWDSQYHDFSWSSNCGGGGGI